MGLKVIRVCDTCRREFEQDMSYFIRPNVVGYRTLTVSILELWQCSDCIIKEERLRKSVVIRPKSEWQKDDCLFCDDVSTLEAVCYGEKPNHLVTIRCCRKPECQEKAKEFAVKMASI